MILKAYPTPTSTPTPTPTRTPTPTPTRTPTLTRTPTSITHPIIPGYNYHCAIYNNGTLLLCATVSRTEASSLDGDPVTVTARYIVSGRPVSNATINMTWYYYGLVQTCQATTNSNGIASCTKSTPWVGTRTYTVSISVSAGGISTSTSFVSTYY